MGLSILKLLLPHLIDFVASLLNPNKPGPTLERMSILMNVLLIVLLGYLANAAWAVHEQHVEVRSKFEVLELESKHLKEDVDEYRDKNSELLAELKRVKASLAECQNRCTAPAPLPRPEPIPVKKPEVKKPAGKAKPHKGDNRNVIVEDINHE